MPTYIQGVAYQWGHVVTGLCGTHRIRLDVSERFRFPESIELRIDHRADLPCGTAKVWTDNTGLRFELEANSREAWRAVADIRAGRLTGCSVSMEIDGCHRTESGKTFFDAVQIVELREVSVCQIPGDPTSLVQVSDRSIVPADRNGLFNDWRIRNMRQRLLQMKRKSKPKPINIGPIPKAMLNAMAAMKAVREGRGANICGLNFSYESLTALLNNRGPMAIR